MPRPRPNVLLFRILTVLVAVTGLVLTFWLARTGHETAGLVAVMTVLVPLLVSINKER
jgi:hypothetical protein